MNSEKEKQKQREHLLQKAKLQLMMRPDTMFFTTILFSLVYIWDTAIPTAAVDGRHLCINPDFFDFISPEERLGVFVHEVLHVALDHITRGLEHDLQLSNNAADYVVNLIVLNAGFKLPTGCLIDTRFKDMSYEQVYKILLDEQKTNKNLQGGGAAGNSGNNSIPSNEPYSQGIGRDILPPANKAEASQLKAEITDMTLRATVQAKQAGAWGSIPGTVLIELDKTLNPQLPWNIIFRNFMNEFAKDDYTWRRPNRRYLPDIIMPSAYSERCSNITFAVDCSGSVSDQEFGLFAQEIQVVQQELLPEKIILIDFDSKIRAVHEITQNTNILKDIHFTGRGGTNVFPLMAWAKEHEPELLVIFTDGNFRNPPASEYPDRPVFWIIHNNPNFVPEQGDVIHYQI